jgi:hypothetical protein
VAATVRRVAEAHHHTPRVCRHEYLLEPLLHAAQSDPLGLAELVERKGPDTALAAVLQLRSRLQT